MGWPTTAADARRQIEESPDHGFRQFSIDGGRLYGESDQGWCLLWAPDECEEFDPAFDL
jgi:hypothetical protein